MPRALKRALVAAGGAAGLLLLLALAAPLFLDLDRLKPELEAAASESLGMAVRIDGRVGVRFLPGPHVALDRGRILGERGSEVGSARSARVYFDLLPMLGREFRLRRIELTQPRLSIERDSTGALNIERLKRGAALLGRMDGGSVRVTNGTLRYEDQRSGRTFEATGLDLSVGRIHLAEKGGPIGPKNFSFEATLTCAEMRSDSASGTALRMVVKGNGGVFVADPVTMRLFGGQGKGSIHLELTGAVPRCRIRASLPRFRIEESLRILSPVKAAEGEMSFATDLAMEGTSWSGMVETATGEVSLRGRDLTLLSHDLDGAISRFEASRTFNFVDVGAVFLAGPLGLAVTKGYTFATLFQGTGGTTKLGTVVSDWKVERGSVRAKDVAMATAENRLAVQGGLDFVHRRFEDLTVAVVDDKGCAKLRQTIRGSFEEPEVDKPHVLASLAGPLVSVLKTAKDLLPAGPCDAFYSGAVEHPSREPAPE